MVTREPNNSGTDHSVMRELNRSLVLDVLKKDSPISRATIARETSLAKPTVSAIVEDLIEDGLVREIGPGPTASGGGRPPIMLQFNARSEFFIGMQIGVRRTNLVVADALGEELGRASVDTPAGPAAEALEELAAQAEQLLKGSTAARKRLSAVGVCVPGLVDNRTGTCLLAPNLGWQDVPVADLLHGITRVPVYVVNTTQAAVVVENIDGAAQGAENVVLLYVGRGVGAGILAEGRLLHGSNGLTGEIGHCHVPGETRECNCGKVGCLETVADGPAIARSAVEAVKSGEGSVLSSLSPEDLTAKDVAEAAADGDAVATQVLEGAGRALGLAGSWLINLFNPDVLLVGGGVAEAGDPLMEPLREAAQEHTLPQSLERVEIRPWTLGRDAGVSGAVIVAQQNSERYYRVIFQG